MDLNGLKRPPLKNVLKKYSFFDDWKEHHIWHLATTGEKRINGDSKVKGRNTYWVRYKLLVGRKAFSWGCPPVICLRESQGLHY